jgi:phosphoribosylglycinamide formyltransferase-1
MDKIRIAIFASGTGSNAMNLIRTFLDHDRIEVAFVLSNRQDAGIVSTAPQMGIDVLVHTNEELKKASFLTEICRKENVEWIVLAGYLRLIPAGFIKAFPRRIINLHPSLLPKYGGKGMHGANVHRTVLENKESQSGITIHYVNEKFDDGEIIDQFKCDLNTKTTLEELQHMVSKLEQENLPKVVENTILSAKA